jgi:hypothetical protein
MRLLRVTTLYESYLRAFYGARPGLAAAPYAAQRAALDHDAFGWADFWGHALERLGYETLDVALNATELLRAWGREHLPEGAPARAAAAEPVLSITLRMARWFRPDVLWYDHDDAGFLDALRAEVPSVKGVLGWTGSAVGGTAAWRAIDLMLTCSPEAAENCAREGLRAAVLEHAFDPRVFDGTTDDPKRWRVSFIGQLLESEGFHGTRAQLLRRVAAPADVTLFVPRSPRPWRAALRRALAGRGLRSPVRDLLRGAHDGVYGLAMYQVLRDSRATLNVHADSSPRFASNMRLFEATGVGTCLVTDWKENMDALFEPDREVVLYRSAEECAEKLAWLAEHPDDAAAIGAAGRRRTLASHTFAHRAPTLDRHVRSVL